MDDMSRAVALRDEARLVETLRGVGETLAAELDREKLIQAATDAATEVTKAEFGAFFYNVIDERGESYTLYTLAGASREAFADFPMPRNTAIFGPTFRGEGVVRLDDVTQDLRYGQNLPYRGMPVGHLPVRSYLAVPVVSRSGEVLGVLFFGHSRVGVFTRRAERLATGIAAQAAIAIDNARLYGEARDAVRARDQFLSMASHELRTPLAAIKATAQAALRASSRGMLDKARSERSLRTIASSTDHVARLASDLLDVARLRSGTMPIQRTAIHLNALLQQVADGFRDQWEGRRELILELATAMSGSTATPIDSNRSLAICSRTRRSTRRLARRCPCGAPGTMQESRLRSRTKASACPPRPEWRCSSRSVGRRTRSVGRSKSRPGAVHCTPGDRSARRAHLVRQPGRGPGLDLRRVAAVRPGHDGGGGCRVELVLLLPRQVAVDLRVELPGSPAV